MNVLSVVGKSIFYRCCAKHVVQVRNVAAAPSTDSHVSEAALFDELVSKTKGKKLEKVIVKVNLKDGEKTLLMNKGISTPYHCALHINKGLADSSALCIIRSEYGSVEELSSMRQPLRDGCKMDFVSLQSEEYAEQVNQAYWRSCSLLLGSLLSSSFNEPAQPIGALATKYSDGYFGYDIKSKNLDKWEPTSNDFSSLVLSLYDRMVDKKLPFDTLLVESKEAELFSLGSSHQREGKSLLCRIGEHVESVDGPVISHAGQIGRFAILKTSKKGNGMWRFSGVSLPNTQSVSSYNWGIITDHSRKVAP